jgi:hypothetical protein
LFAILPATFINPSGINYEGAMMILKRICGVLATGYILMFYSEHMFWAHVRADDSLSGWLMTWLVYSLTGYVFLELVVRFRAHSIWAIFLCGAVFGWLTEGVVVQTVYEDLPLSLSFTGLAWHAAISVLVGWHLVRKALQTGLRPTLVLSMIIGVIYGLWAISWWNEPGERITPIMEFAVFALATQVMVIIAYWVYDHTIAESFSPNRVAEIILGMLILLYFIFVTIPAAPMAAWILPGLLLIVYLTLRRNLKQNGDGSALSITHREAPTWNYAGLVIIPLAAILVYALAYSLELRWHTNWILHLIATPLGFGLFIVSLIKIWRDKPVNS